MREFGKSYRVIIEPDSPAGFVAVVPAVPGLIAYADTSEEALSRLRAGLREHLSSLASAEQPLPDDSVGVAWDEDDEHAEARIVTVEV